MSCEHTNEILEKVNIITKSLESENDGKKQSYADLAEMAEQVNTMFKSYMAEIAFKLTGNISTLGLNAAVVSHLKKKHCTLVIDVLDHLNDKDLKFKPAIVRALWGLGIYDKNMINKDVIRLINQNLSV